MSGTSPSAWERAQKERQAQAKARLLDLLRRHAIAQAEVEYDGYGDSGQVEHQSFFNQERRRWPSGTLRCPAPWTSTSALSCPWAERTTRAASAP